MTRVRYRPYDPALNSRDLELLADVDEYYPDLLETLGGLESPKIFITCWLLHDHIPLDASTTFRGMLIRELRKSDAEVYILWNTNYSGLPFPGLKRKASRLHRTVVKAAEAGDDQLKIILSTNLQFDPPDLSWQTDLSLFGAQVGSWFGGDAPPDVLEFLETLWLKEFPADVDDYRNLAVPTLGSHHQKTVIVLGTKDGGETLTGYCGGIDFSSGPAGRSSSTATYFGGGWWHDAVMRVRGHAARPILANFIERWNRDLAEVQAGRTLAYGVSAGDTLDTNLSAGAVDGTVDAGELELPRTIPIAGVNWPGGLPQVLESRGAYETWVPDATDHLILINQYFRHPDVAELVAEQLEDEVALRVTVVIPSYAEEVSKRRDLLRTRDRHAAPGLTDEQRTAIRARAQRLSLTIDPLNKLTLYLRSRALAPLTTHARCRVWIPRPLVGRKIRGIPYVHTKMFMVDRKALMVGSANVNGRALDGRADTEINVLTTDQAEIDRLFSIHKWDVEPDSEAAGDYEGTWYHAHNLIRYTEDHRLIDRDYGQFPSGRDGVLDYFDRFGQHGRLEKLGITFDRSRVEARLDNVPPGFDIDGDIGAQLAAILGHLV